MVRKRTPPPNAWEGRVKVGRKKGTTMNSKAYSHPHIRARRALDPDRGGMTGERAHRN